MKLTKEMVEELHNKTEGGYSYDRYNSWRACCRFLLKVGFTMEQAEVILLSKWMRWAGDYSSHDYGKITSKDLEKYLHLCSLQDYVDIGIGDGYQIFQDYLRKLAWA